MHTMSSDSSRLMVFGFLATGIPVVSAVSSCGRFRCLSTESIQIYDVLGEDNNIQYSIHFTVYDQ